MAVTRSYYGTTPEADRRIRSRSNKASSRAQANAYVTSLERRARGDRATAGPQDQSGPYTDYGQMMTAAGMSNQAKFADGVAVGDEGGGSSGRGRGGRGGRGGGGGGGAGAALAAMLAQLDLAASRARQNHAEGVGTINSVYDELNARLGNRARDYDTQVGQAARALAIQQQQASQGLDAQLGRSEQALAAQFGGNTAASLADGNAAQMAALRAALGMRQSLDQENQGRVAQVGREGLQQRVTDSGTARAGALATNANALGAILQEIENRRLQMGTM